MTKELTYTKTYINCSRQDLLKALAARVNAKRFKHILGVEETAIKMGEKAGLDSEKLSIAALLHDYAKDMDEVEMLDLAQKFWPEVDLSGQNDNIWHGPAAAQIAIQDYGVSDLDILNAIRSHTIGNYEMDIIAQIICVADYIEPGRNFDGVDKARKLADKDIIQAMLYKFSHSLMHMLEDQEVIFEESFKIYNAWASKLKK